MRSKIILFLAGIILSSSLLICAQSLAEDRPNVILIMADDLGWGDPSFNGGWIQTPGLDSLAEKGLKFTRFYSASPVCSPTRASCLSGRHPYRLGIRNANNGHLRQEEVVISELLQQAGYRTGHFGKWHLGTLTTERKDSNRGRPGNFKDYSPPWHHGFDTSFSTEAKVPTFHPMRRPENKLPLPTEFKDPNFYGTYYWVPPANKAAWANASEGVPVPVTENLDGDDSKIIMDRAIPFVEEAVQAKLPFFAVIWFHTPHKPVVDPEQNEPVDSKAAYQAAVQQMDQQVGRLNDELARLGAKENTMIWFCSDNGPERGVGQAGPLRARKRSLHEGGIRVPAFLTWPAKIEHGNTLDFVASTSDYLPTILDLVGLPPQPSSRLDGISLRKMIEGKSEQRDQPIGFQSGKQIAWITQNHKIVSKNAGQSFELYDLVNDPRESSDLAATQPELLDAMTKDLNVWLDAVEQDAPKRPSD